MHELSVALGIVDVATKELEKKGAAKAKSIELVIGTISGVEMAALDYVWDTAVKNTVLEGTVRKIETIPAKGKCLECHTVFDMDTIYDGCTKCGSYFKDILQGKELRVKALEIS